MGSCLTSWKTTVIPRNTEDENENTEEQVDDTEKRPYLDFGADYETWLSFKQKWRIYKRGLPESLYVPHLLFRCTSEKLCDLLLISDPTLIKRSEEEVLLYLENNVVTMIDGDEQLSSDSPETPVKTDSSTSALSYIKQGRPNLEFIWSNFQDVSDEIFSNLDVEDLINIHETCSAGTNAIISFIRMVGTINNNQGSLNGLDKISLELIIPYTKMLQTFTTSNPLADADVFTLFANNAKLREFSYSSIPQFHRLLLTSSCKKYPSLTHLNLMNGVGVNVDEEDIAEFFEKLSKLCFNIKHLRVETNDDVINEDSLWNIGQFSKLQSLKLEDVVISGRLSRILSGCPRLKLIHLVLDVIGEYTLKDIASCCQNLQHFSVSAYDVRPGDEERDFAEEARDIILSNTKLQTFNFDSGDFASMNDRTLDAMTDHLDNLKEISFGTDSFFSEIGESFTRFLNKFKNLSKLEVKIENGLSQDWFDAIASKCSNLNYLSLTEYDVEGNEERNTRLSRIDVSQIFENNPNLTEVEI